MHIPTQTKSQLSERGKSRIKKMELMGLWMAGVAVLFGYMFVFGIVKRINEWYYVGRLRLFSNTEFNLPPGHLGWPLLGNMLPFYKAFKSDPDSFTYNLLSKYGRGGIYKTHLFGYPSVIVSSPESCRAVLTDEERFKVGYPTSTLSLFGKRAFYGISNTEHKRLRRLTTAPIAGLHALSLYVTLMEQIAVEHLEELAKATVDGPIELLPELRKFAFDVITNIFVGSDVQSVDLGQVENLYTDISNGIMSLPFNLPGFAYHKALKARKKLVKLLQGVLEKKKRRSEDNISNNERKKDMMDLLIEVRDEDGSPIEDEDITDLLLVFLLAGHESSAHGICFTLIYLNQNPHILNRAMKEQQDILTRRPSTQKGLDLTEIRQMEYLSKAIDEMQRITSISFSHFRQATEDVNINGYTIPKGWKVLVWNRGVHMDPETYANPKEFDPSRWENFRGKAGSFLPFGLGGRICPGKDLAKIEIQIFLHHFLLNYRMERMNEGSPWTYLPLPRPSDNCLARIIRVP